MSEEEVDGTAVEEEISPPDVVIVVKTTDENGNIDTAVSTQGNVLPTEVQTILELGVQRWRRQVGLDR